MVLVIGGLASGKRDFVKSEYRYSDDDISSDVFSAAPVLFDLQEIINTDSDSERFFPELLNKKVVICSDISCGIVPIDRAEREKREAVGRLCIRLASSAERVVRIQCGIPQIIKG
jgi:adenosyl cobinamide kinase/adenosyl cobinamide phosphate guanylyltransferase